MPTTVVQIPGIHCGSCVMLIKDVSAEFPQIQQVDVDVDTKKVTIAHGNDFDLSQWKEEIEALGETYKITHDL